LSLERAVSPPHIPELPRRVGIFAQLLLAFLLVALLPLTTFWQFERTRSIKDGEEVAQERLRLFSERVVQQVNDWTQQNLSVLKLAARLSETISMDPQAHKRIVVSVAQQLPWAYLIHSTDLAGMNVARSDDQPLTSYQFRSYYADVLRGAAYSADIQLGHTYKRPAFMMAVPISGPNGQLRGMLTEAATLDAVSKAVTSANLGRTGFAFLMTPEGRLIANAHEPSNQDLKDYSTHPAFTAAKAGNEGIQHYVVDGIDRTAMIRRTDLGWIAVAQQNTQESLAGVNQATRSALFLLVVTAALVTSLSLMVARGFAKPIERVTQVANQISQGNLDFTISTNRRDQIGDLIRAMQGVRQTLQRFVDAERQIAKEHERGDIDFKIDGDSFSGVYKEMADAVNDLVAEQVALAMLMRDVIERYAIGDFSLNLPPLPGKKRMLTEAIEMARQNLIAMQEQIVCLVYAAARGDFSVRGDETSFQNAFRDMVRHLNHLMETADGGLGEVASVLAAIAKGNLTVQMKGAYEGTFANLKRDINTTVEALATLIHQIEFNRGLLRATLEHLPQGVSVVDADLHLVAWNRRYVEIFDFPPDLVQVGRPIEALMRYNAERGLLGRGDAEANIQRRIYHLRTGNTHAHERELPGDVVLEIRGNPVPGVGYATSYTDVSAYKRVEEKLRALADSLERRVSERTEDLQRAMAEADRANRSKSKFLAAAVHDLSQPINAARLYVSAIKEALRNQPVADLAEHAERSFASAEGLFASLMDISRLESGKLKLKFEDVRLEPMLESLSREFRMLARSHGLELHCVMTTAVVRTDIALLRRVLQNFLSNAVRYTPSGRILLGVRRIRAGFRIEVWDTGCGIAADKIEEIFEEFRRLDFQQAGIERGAGLGLAIVRTIAKLLNYEVKVRSWTGLGSVFSIEVPRGDVSMLQEATELAPIAEAGLCGRKVWCIDDDRDVREATRTLLERWGCLVTLCASGDECLRTANCTDAPDLLILDYGLGDCAGPDLLPELESIWGRVVPVVIVSGEHATLLEEALRDAPWSVLAKPIRPEELRTEMLAMLALSTSDS
jgi:signal transduction histidine kinase/CheY-like chemotaxis protein/HAMP domain-containing protein